MFWSDFSDRKGCQSNQPNKKQLRYSPFPWKVSSSPFATSPLKAALQIHFNEYSCSNCGLTLLGKMKQHSQDQTVHRVNWKGWGLRNVMYYPWQLVEKWIGVCTHLSAASLRRLRWLTSSACGTVNGAGWRYLSHWLLTWYHCKVFESLRCRLHPHH